LLLSQGVHVPPQSTPVSLPSFTPSLQVVATQTWVIVLQAIEVQSDSCKHCFPSGHAAQMPPPQSTSVSLPSLTWSSHVEATQVPEPMSHTVDAQSRVSLQSLPTAQAAQVPPPQSTSVSLPSLTPSAHSDGTHLSATQVRPTLQSPSSRHCTQTPLPLHLVPAEEEQTAPAASGTEPGVPSAAQVEVTHGFELVGTLRRSTPRTTCPVSSQTIPWQSGGESGVMTVPSATRCCSHIPARQIGTTQALLDAGQSELRVHPASPPPSDEITPGAVALHPVASSKAASQASAPASNPESGSATLPPLNTICEEQTCRALPHGVITQ
jgi:hypothetical protein